MSIINYKKVIMEVIKYNGNTIDSDNKKGLVGYNKSYGSNGSNGSDNLSKPVDFLSVKNAYQTMIIQKTMETHELISNYLSLTHPLTKMTLAFILLNPFQTLNMVKTNSVHLFSFGMFMKRSITAIIYRKPQPVKKTFEICYIVDNSINHLYVAVDWYLKSNSKVKKAENYTVMMMTKPIEASKKEKDYPILKTVPEEKETEFVYDNYTFSYSKSSYDDVIYAPSGEMKKKNHKLLIWSYDCSSNTFDNLSSHIINLYAKSKVDEIWVQKIFTHENGMWKDSILDRNKRKMVSVIMKGNKNLEISELLNHFTQTEEWHMERGIPYKKSFLFYGPPGTGKSSMIKAMSFELQRHIHYLNLSLIKNDQELTNLMSKINYKETILVIEDIDAQASVVHKRFKSLETDNTQSLNQNNTFNLLSGLNGLNNSIQQIIPNDNLNLSGLTNTNLPQQSVQQSVQHPVQHPVQNIQTQQIDPTTLLALSTLINNQKNNEAKNDLDKKEESKTHITLSGILNQIDGVHNNHGMILIMTTNYPEKLDEALIRDGRVDERIFFDYCDYDQIHLMFKNFYNGNSVGMDIIKSHINLSEYKVAPCNVENSMRRYYSNQMAALEDIVNSIKGKKTFEKFDF